MLPPRSELLSGRRQRWRLRQPLRLVFILVVLGALVLAGRVIWPSATDKLPAKGAETVAASPRRVNVLLMGVDERPGDIGRADTMILVSADPGAGQVHALSFARDTWVEIPEHGWDKLNAAFALGGPQLARRTVEKLVGLPVPNYAVVNMSGFRKLVELLGGVEVAIESDMYYDDPYDTPPLHIALKAGRQRLTPLQALHFARFRADAEADRGRMRRQQQLMQAIAREAMQPRNLRRLPALVSAGYDMVETDFGATDLVKMATLAPLVTRLEFSGQSLDGADVWIDGVYYLEPDFVAARRLAHQVLTGSEAPAAFVATARRDEERYVAAIATAEAEAAARQPPPPPGGPAPPPPARPTPPAEVKPAPPGLPVRAAPPGPTTPAPGAPKAPVSPLPATGTVGAGGKSSPTAGQPVAPTPLPGSPAPGKSPAAVPGKAPPTGTAPGAIRPPTSAPTTSPVPPPVTSSPSPDPKSPPVSPAPRPVSAAPTLAN